MGFNGFPGRLGNQICATTAHDKNRKDIMKIRTSCLLLTTLLLAGCWQKSLNPFYTAKDVVSDPKLAGTWKEHKEDDTGNETDRMIWNFAAAEDKRFDLLVQSDKDQQKYDAHLFKLDDNCFLDIVSQERAISAIPGHHLFKVVELGADLKLAALNIEWMQKWLQEHPNSLTHITLINPEHRDDRDHDELVLTADTKALQNFVREHLKDEKFFGEATVFKKQSGAGGNETK
jgi:hypothetical protein